MKCTRFLAGMGLGIAVGAMLGMASMTGKKPPKPQLCRFLRNVGDALDSITQAISR